jgi:hypothetical protein
LHHRGGIKMREKEIGEADSGVSHKIEDDTSETSGKLFLFGLLIFLCLEFPLKFPLKITIHNDYELSN